MLTRTPKNPQGALALHLALAMLPWLASNAALKLSRSGSDGWSGPLPDAPLPPPAARLRKQWLALASDPLLAQAAEAEARKRAAEFLKGLQHYQQAPFTRELGEPPAMMQVGAARLLDYGGERASPAVFLIPSLINRYYILDLTRKLSFARYLRARGMRVFVVDWGVPENAEAHFNCALYVTEILVPMMERIHAEVSAQVIAGGYCMGGTLALALAQIRPDLADGLALFAAPWDFSAPDFPRVPLSEDELALLERYIAGGEAVPAETIHTLFHCANPYAFQNKLREFARMDPAHPATREFLEIEHWVNDGVPMTRGVARDCLIEWSQRNSPACRKWHVGGQVIDPARLGMPCFVAAPRGDRIVPSGCALPLARRLKKCTLIEPGSGHVGMMVGSRRKTALWEPFGKWIDAQFT